MTRLKHYISYTSLKVLSPQHLEKDFCTIENIKKKYEIIQ